MNWNEIAKDIIVRFSSRKFFSAILILILVFYGMSQNLTIEQILISLMGIGGLMTYIGVEGTRDILSDHILLRVEDDDEIINGKQINNHEENSREL